MQSEVEINPDRPGWEAFLRCARCGGCMAPQDLWDYCEVPMWQPAERCVSCGYVRDPVIERHHRIFPAWRIIQL